MKTGIGSSVELKAGIARGTITPPVGVDLTGYAGRPGPSAGVHDELNATAIVLDDGAARVGIVCLDLLGLDFEQDAKLRTAVSAATGIDKLNLLITSSHTHGGPATQTLRECGKADECYLRWAFSQITATAGRAVESIAPAAVSVARAQSDLALNRRNWVIDAGVQASPTSGVITDPEVFSVILDIEGHGTTLLYNYGCHGVVMGNENLQTTADWIGAATAMLQADPAIDTAVFLQGCCGNINPRIRGTFEDVATAGEMVARPVLGSLKHATPVTGAIRTAWRKTELPLLPLPEEEELEQQITYYREELEKKRAQGSPAAAMHVDTAHLMWAQDALKQLCEGGHPDVQPIAVQGIRIGDLVIAALPGEVFCEIGLRIKSMRREPTFVVGYANGNIGYIPTAEAYSEGGYETQQAYKFYGTRMIGPECEELVVAAAAEVIQELDS